MQNGKRENHKYGPSVSALCNTDTESALMGQLNRIKYAQTDRYDITACNQRKDGWKMTQAQWSTPSKLSVTVCCNKVPD